MCPELHEVLLTAFEAASEGELNVIHRGSIDVKNVSRDFGVICQRAGVNRYAKPIHSLRKSCITDWAKKHPAHVVQEWAGHASVETACSHYLKVSGLEYERAASTRLMPEVTQLWTQLVLELGNQADMKTTPARIRNGHETSCDNSGRSDSNRRRPAWEAGILPLNYARTRNVLQLYELTARGQSVSIRVNTLRALFAPFGHIRIPSFLPALATLTLSAHLGLGAAFGRSQSSQ